MGSGAPGSGGARALVGRYADLALAALVVAIVGMMIVPLPAFALDLLIALNIGVAVTLLLVSIYVADALRIATFPTLLLLTTLFRLALEVSATRLVLVRADAGQVIAAFGSFVVAGNVVAGAVIFFILTVIQYVVVSKGAERVAEVAARFTLDALPGRQMAIDADLRAGHIDGEEARRRRAALARESQLFGAMDGAMKFVKGDAVAGIVILGVNIVGGLVIGVVQRGMDVATAARTYTLLTIGEGLVAQIPALVIALAAGVVVTRVASEDDGAGRGGSHLGREIGAEILGHPKALAFAAGLLGVLALVPGLPAAPFLILAGAIGLVAWRLLREDAGPRGARRLRAAQGDWPADDVRYSSPAPVAVPSRPPPLAIELGSELAAALGGAAAGRRLAASLVPAVADRLLAETGLPLPEVAFRAPATGLPARSYRVRLDDVPIAERQAPADAHAAEEQIAGDLTALMRRHGHERLGIQETQVLLAALERTHPALVREIVPRLVTLPVLAGVLRRLAAEGISLRALPEILDSFGALAGRPAAERDAATLAEHARAALRRAITFRHTRDGAVAALALDPIIEDTLREALHATPAGDQLALEPALRADILTAVGRALQAAPPGPVVLAAPDLRPHVRRLLEPAYPDLSVLSPQELLPDVRVETVGRIEVGM
jgi:type III secretion protein V